MHALDLHRLPALTHYIYLRFQVHNASLHAKDASGKVLGTHTLFQAGPAAKLTLYIDAPNPSTGTGRPGNQLDTGAALVLDGHDAGLLRVAVEVRPTAACSTAALHILNGALCVPFQRLRAACADIVARRGGGRSWPPRALLKLGH